MFKRISKILIGKRLPTAALSHERLSKPQGLAIFASDSLSSTAYATEEILLVLVLAGGALINYALPISIAITLLIAITAVSYRQLIHAHPHGGGAYHVARKHLGEFPSLVVAASLLFDYILTAAVSISAGVAAITSAAPALYPHRVALAILLVVFLTIINLRGVRESGKIFAIPTYFFVGSFCTLIGVGIYKYAIGAITPITYPVLSAESGLGLLGALLVIRAFAAGCTAMTGLEATANGVQSFKSPEAKNANRVLVWMAGLLAVIFIGITSLAMLLHIVPQAQETVISQIAHQIFGGGVMYFIIQASTVFILILAANTPFAALPRLSSLLARDKYLPRQFFTLGSRLVYANGIAALAILASLLLAYFNADTHKLIPLYAVGVFIGFTIAQWSMVRHWQEQKTLHPELNFRFQKNINLIGSIVTFAVLVIVFFSKFTHGAWLVLPSLFGIIVMMRIIRAHYVSVANQLSLIKNPMPKIPPDRTVILLISGVHHGSIKGLEAAKNMNPAHLRAVFIAIDPVEAPEVELLWKKYGEGVPLDIIPSPERNIIEPLAKYIAHVDRRWENDTIILVIPEFVPLKPWEHLLHSQTALQIRWSLSHMRDVEILDVPYRLRTHKSLNIMHHIIGTFADIANVIKSFAPSTKGPFRMRKD